MPHIIVSPERLLILKKLATRVYQGWSTESIINFIKIHNIKINEIRALIQRGDCGYYKQVYYWFLYHNFFKPTTLPYNLMVERIT